MTSSSPERRSPQRFVLLDSKAQVRQPARPLNVRWLEPNPEAARNLEQVDAIAEQDRGEVDNDLIEKAALETLPGDAGAEQSDAPALRRIDAIALDFLPEEVWL